MSRIISFEYLKKTVNYLRDLRIEINERDPYQKIYDYARAKTNLSKNERLCVEDKIEIREILDIYGSIAQEDYEKALPAGTG